MAYGGAPDSQRTLMKVEAELHFLLHFVYPMYIIIIDIAIIMLISIISPTCILNLFV